MSATDDQHLPFDELARSVRGAVHLAGTPEFAAAATPWNLSITNPVPAVVVAQDAADVAAAIRFGRSHGLRVSVQCTGHGTAACEWPTLLVSTRELRELEVSETGSARVGAGIRSGEVVEAAAARGFAPVVGASPNVGFVGYLSGGGQGPVARTFGISSDHVTAVDVVTGDGGIRRASATENPDLFWAVRGDRGALGIVTAVEVDCVALREIYGGCLYFAAADIERVAHAWREWTATLPEQATSSFVIARAPDVPGVPEPLAGKVAAAVRFAWVGDPDAGRVAFAPMREVAPPILGGVDVMPYTAIGSIHNDPVNPAPSRECSAQLAELPAAALDALLARSGPDSGTSLVAVELRHFGGAIARHPRHPSAFTVRDDAYSLFAPGIATPATIDAVVADQRALEDAVRPWSSGRLMLNTISTNDPHVITRKYDRETLHRLAELAQHYDPDGVISASIGVRAAAELV